MYAKTLTKRCQRETETVMVGSLQNRETFLQIQCLKLPKKIIEALNIRKVTTIMRKS